MGMKQVNKRPPRRRPWTKEQELLLKVASRERQTVAALSRLLKRSQRALRQKAYELGIALGHRKRRERKASR